VCFQVFDLTKRSESQRVVVVCVRRAQLVDDVPNGGVRREEDESHAVGQVKHGLVAGRGVDAKDDEHAPKNLHYRSMLGLRHNVSIIAPTKESGAL
jgi:hypothetical protein